MIKYLRHIAAIALVVVYIFSTSGFLIKYGLCFCANRISVELDQTGQSQCPVCHMDMKIPKPGSDCKDHFPKISHENDCCKTEFRYLRYEAVSNIVNTLNPEYISMAFLIPFPDAKQATTDDIKATLLQNKSGPPDRSSRQLVIFLHHLVFSPEEAA